MSTYAPIQTIRITSDTATITFTGIPQTYTDLVIVGNVASTSDDLVPTVRVGNGTIDTGSNYSQTTGGFIAGAGIASFRDTSDTRMRFGRGGFSTTQPVGVFTLHFQNYSNTTTNKTVLARNSAFDRTVTMCAGTWRSTSAINTIQFTEYSGGTYVSGSTFTLYGIGSGSPKAFGGSEVRTDGTYWYHIFRSSGRFEPVQNLTDVDYLVIAGGGGGGGGGSTWASVGGGGAGGYRTSLGTSGGNSSAESKFTATSNIFYTVTVGAGGNGAAGYNGVAGIGSDSVFGSIVSLGGGGGSSFNIAATSGGSGGGGYHVAINDSTETPGAAGTTGQGFAGGNGLKRGDTTGNGGGGGGAGSVGGNRGSSTGGSGGAGISSSITGSAVTRASGGGGGGSSSGGSGGTGGGGAGGSGQANGSSATANTGGGGGGAGGGSSGGATSGGNGGSGIVIVRYAV
jgi:hypothetical protein